MFGNILKMTARILRRQKGYALITIGGLAVALAVGVLAIAWTCYEFSYDRFHRNGADIYRLVSETENLKSPNAPFPLGPALTDALPEVLQSARIMGDAPRLESPRVVNFDSRVYLVDPSFLTMFDFPFVQGDVRTALSDPSSAVLTESAARLFFGTADPIGQTLLAGDSKIPMKVAGLIKDVPRTSSLRFDVLVPIKGIDVWYRGVIPKGYFFDNWTALGVTTYARLVPGTDVRALEAKIARLVKEKSSKADYTLSLQPLFRVHLFSGDFAVARPPDIGQIRIFLIISLLVLLVAGINYVNLATAWSLKRAKEIGVRKVSGAGRGQIARQFLGESILLAFIALAGAVVLAMILLPAFRALSGRDVDIGLVPKIPLAISLVGLTLFTGLLSGLYPAFFVSSFSPVRALKEKFRPGRPSFINLRRLLVAVQISGSAGLIVLCGVFLLQFRHIAQKDLGYDPRNIVVVPLFDDQHASALKNDLLRNTSILSAAHGLTPTMPLDVHRASGDRIDWEGKRAGANISMDVLNVDADYAKTYGLTLKSGRFFSNESAADRQNFVINESAVLAMGLADPVGKTMTLLRTTGQIVGVVKDFHMRTLRAKIMPMILSNTPFSRLSIRIDPAKTPEAIRHIEASWKTYYPERTLDYLFLEDMLSRMYDDDRKAARIVIVFGGLSLALSCLGLFGLVSFMAEQRTKEIGIRKVLGASLPAIVRLMFTEFPVLAVLAVVAAWPVAFVIAQKWLSGFAYRINLGWWIFVASGCLVFIAALLAMGLRAVRAAAADPVDSLRYE